MGDYAGYRQFKGVYHVHTTNSDGNAPFWQVVEDYYRRNYDILAITDHNKLTNALTSPTVNAVSRDRAEEMAAGVGRGGRRMLLVPYGVEQTGSPWHINTFFLNSVQYGNQTTLLDQVVQNNAVAHINHIGWTTAGFPGAPTAVNNQGTVDSWANVLKTYSATHLPGIENVSWIQESWERVIWDNINLVTIPAPTNRIVRGFANDDSHSLAENGFAFNMMVMPENTAAALKTCMQTGRHYSVSRVATSEGMNNQWRGAPTPIIRDITVTGSRIEIAAENHTRIDWKSPTANGIAPTIATGDAVNMSQLSNLGPFIRANVVGPGAIAFTQPYRISGGAFVPHYP